MSVLSFVECLFEPGADPAKRGTGLEDVCDALFAQRSGVSIGNYAAAEHEHIAEFSINEFGHDPWEQCQMCSREQRQPDSVGVFLQNGLSDLFGSLMEAGVDDFEPVVAQGPGDCLGPAVMPIESGLCHDDTVRTLHE